MARIKMQEGIGYAIIPDPVTNNIGPVGAMVFGAVLRHYLMRNNMCYASQQTIATKAMVSRKTANLWLQELVKGDYLRLGENEKIYDTCIYIPTRKTGLDMDDNELEVRYLRKDNPPDEEFDI